MNIYDSVFWYGYGTHGQALLPQAAFVSRCISLVKNNKFPHLVVFKTKNLSEGNMDVEPLDIPRSTDLWGFFWTSVPRDLVWAKHLSLCSPCFFQWQEPRLPRATEVWQAKDLEGVTFRDRTNLVVDFGRDSKNIGSGVRDQKGLQWTV